jgi:hypothetical protein
MAEAQFAALGKWLLNGGRGLLQAAEAYGGALEAGLIKALQALGLSKQASAKLAFAFCIGIAAVTVGSSVSMTVVAHIGSPNGQANDFGCNRIFG